MAAARFVFRDYKGLVQLRIASPDDLDRIHDLPPARWSATSVPVEQLLCDRALLDHLDADQDGRIRVHDLRAAHDWLRLRLRHLDRLVERTDTVWLDDLDASQPDAARLRNLARRRIKASGQAAGPGASISLEDIRAFRDTYARRHPNGDGVVAPDQIRDADVARLAALIVDATGGVAELGGAPGVAEEQLEAFLALGRAHLAWAAEGRLPEGAATTAILPFGEATAAAYELVDALSAKLDQFFAQCELLSQGSPAEARLAITADALAPIDIGDPGSIRAWLQGAALGKPNAEGALDLDGGLNPLFADVARRLAAEVLPRALDMEGPVRRLDRAGWEKVRALFEPHRAWRARRPQALPEGLDEAALKALLDGELPEKLRALIIEDRQASAELVGLSDLEKLALLQRWILDLANNMVSFPAMFSIEERCLFEVGTLVLDGREIDLCVRVADKAAHKAIAERSNIFTVYVELRRKEGDEARTQLIAAGVTSGTRRGIAEGKRGVFYDRDGEEWDAQVIDVIARPISVWEAAIAPFVRLRDFIVENVEKLIDSRLDALEKQAAQQAAARAGQAAAALPAPGAAAPAPPPPAPAPPKPALGGGIQGLLVGGGVAFAAVGSAAAFALQTLSNTDLTSALIAVLTIAVGIMTLSAFLGWLKLRRRDVSTLLEASGWAFNVRIYLRRNLSLRLTRVPPLPAGSVRERQILPPAFSGERRSGWWIVVVVVILALIAAAGWRWHEDLAAWMQEP